MGVRLILLSLERYKMPTTNNTPVPAAPQRLAAPRAALTDKKIAQTKPEAKPYKLADGNGLFLLINPNGSKLWRWKYRVSKVEKLMSLGDYPTTSLSMARQARDAVRRALAEKRDPMEERRSEKLAKRFAAENSFKNVAKLWWDWWSPGKSERHAAQVWRRFETDVFPHLGGRAVSEVQVPEIVNVVKIIAGKPAIEKAKKILWTIGQVFRYSCAHSLATVNPVQQIKPSDILPSREIKHHARVKPNRLPALLRSIEAYDSIVTRLAMKLMAMTFVRTADLIEAPWSEIDFDNAMWVIPGDRIKMKREHTVPLSTQAIDVLRTLHTLTGHGKLIFPNERDHAKPMSNNTILMALKRMGFKGEMTGHGFRGVATTHFYERGFTREHIELQLAHVEKSKTVAAYNDATYLPQRTEMMQIWADHLDAVRIGKPQLVEKIAA